jgi:hypothetical protein
MPLSIQSILCVFSVPTDIPDTTVSLTATHIAMSACLPSAILYPTVATLCPKSKTQSRTQLFKPLGEGLRALKGIKGKSNAPPASKTQGKGVPGTLQKSYRKVQDPALQEARPSPFPVLTTPFSGGAPFGFRAASKAPRKKMLTVTNVMAPGRKKVHGPPKPVVKMKAKKPTLKALLKVAKKYHKKD